MKSLVLDTNVLISALGWNGNERKIFYKCLSLEILLITSPEIIQEFKRTCLHPKLNFTQEEIDDFIEVLLKISKVVSSSEKIDIVRDPLDNHILECALGANVDYIVSGDKDLLSLKEFRNIRILSAKEALGELEK
jgi:uncharacterized protein